MVLKSTILKAIAGLAMLGVALWEIPIVSKGIKLAFGAAASFDFVYERYKDPTWLGWAVNVALNPPPGTALVVAAVGLLLIYWSTQPKAVRMSWPVLGMMLGVIIVGVCGIWYLTQNQDGGTARQTGPELLSQAAGVKAINDPRVDWDAAGRVSLQGRYTRSDGPITIYVTYGQTSSLMSRPQSVISGTTAVEPRIKIGSISHFDRDEKADITIGVVSAVDGNQQIIQWGERQQNNTKVGITWGSYFGTIILVWPNGSEDSYPFAIISRSQEGKPAAPTIVGPSALQYFPKHQIDSLPANKANAASNKTEIISASVETTAPPEPPSPPPRPLSVYEAELKLKAIDKALRTLNDDMQPVIEKFPLQQNWWNALKDPKSDPNFREHLLKFRDDYKDACLKLDSFRNTIPEYQDLVAMLAQPSYQKILKALEKYLIQFMYVQDTVKPDPSKEALLAFMDDHMTDQYNAMNEFIGWRNATRAKVLDLRRAISP